jgi:hypothetical protein
MTAPTDAAAMNEKSKRAAAALAEALDPKCGSLRRSALLMEAVQLNTEVRDTLCTIATYKDDETLKVIGMLTVAIHRTEKRLAAMETV